jgi:hypothetical protein
VAPNPKARQKTAALEKRNALVKMSRTSRNPQSEDNESPAIEKSLVERAEKKISIEGAKP